MSKTLKQSLAICLGLVVGTLAVYWPVTGHEFVNYDDTDYVTKNAHVQAGLSAKSLAWVWSSEVARNWHPLTMLSHMLDCQFFGLRPDWHHATNLLLHAVNAALLFLLLRRLTGALWRSALVAALFAFHPLHVESVAWIAERKDVLSTLFFLLTLWAYGAYVRESAVRCQPAISGGPKPEVRSPKPGMRRGSTQDQGPRAAVHASRSTLRVSRFYLLALLLFALGLMSKPMLVTLPFVLLLLDFWPLGRLTVHSPRSTAHSPRSAPNASRSTLHAPRSTFPALLGLIPEKVPFFLLSAGSCFVTFMVQHKGGAMLDVSHHPLTARVANAVVSYGRYLGKMVWPEHLAALYLRKAPWPAWEVGCAAAFLLAVTFVALRFVRIRPYLAVGWFWYLGTLVPVIGLVQVGMQTMADRYTYIPLIGIFIILAWGGWELVSAWRMPVAVPATAAGLAVAACMVLTRAQLPYWRNSEELFKRMIAVNDGNYMAHYNLGNTYSRRDQLTEAVEQYEAALRAEPDYAEAHNNLGTVLLRLKRFDEAVAHHREAVRIRPEYLFLFNLGNAYVDTGQTSEAIAQYQQALKLDPNASAAHHNLGLVLQAQGKAQEALAEFQTALRLQPDYESAEYHLANRLADSGQLDEAIAHYQAALRLDPKRVETYNGLGICYAMQGKLPEAEQQFREAIRLNPEFAGAQSNLANALGAQDKLDEAIAHYEKALQLAPKDFQTHYNFGLTLVRQGRRAEAKAQFTEALRLHPDYPEARDALARLKAAPGASK
jgi:protein O-mannosyl-transferase